MESYKSDEDRWNIIVLLYYILGFGLLMPSFFINLCGTPSVASTVVFVVAMFGFQVLKIFGVKRENRKEKALAKCENLFQQPMLRTDFVKANIYRELEQEERTGKKLVSKKILRLRIAYSIAFAVFLFVLLSKGFYSIYFWPLVSSLVFAFEMAVFSQNTRRTVFNLAQAHPNKKFSDIIDETTYDDSQKPIAKKAMVFCLSLIIIAVTAFIITHWNSKYILESTEQGYSIKSFQLGLSDDSCVEVPDTIDGKRIVAVSDKAFANNSKIKKVVLPDSIMHIGDAAFKGCSFLENITLGNNMKTIGSAAFKNCYSLSNIKLPDGLVKLNGEAFENCKALNTIVIPKGVTEIRGDTFAGCSELETITLHDEIIDIHAYAFYECYKLSAIELPPKITKIHEYTFEECDSLETIYIPRGVTKISAHAFYGCDSLYDVYFPDSIEEIGSSAFRECESLMEVYLPEGVSINERAFVDSPTELYKKRFTDEESDKISEEIESIKVECIYVLYDKKGGKDSIFSPDGDNTIVVSHTDKIRGQVSESMDLIEFHKPSDFLVYLKKAKKSGIKTVNAAFYSEIATKVSGEEFFVKIQWDIDELITGYENDDTAF